jgi:hypothetical protein
VEGGSPSGLPRYSLGLSRPLPYDLAQLLVYRNEGLEPAQVAQKTQGREHLESDIKQNADQLYNVAHIIFSSRNGHVKLFRQHHRATYP